VNIKDKIEIARNILNNAADMNMSKKCLLKISRKVDIYIIEYYKSYAGSKDDLLKEKKFNLFTGNRGDRFGN
jgi:hypothetical protein